MAGLTIGDPATLRQALASERILPGDVLQLADGTYTGDYSTLLVGTEALPIIIRPANPGNVIIDGSFKHMNGQFLHLYDIDFTDSRTDRTDGGKTNGVYLSSKGDSLFGCRMSNLHSDGVDWFGAGPGEISECIFLNNGYRFIDGTGACHSIYSHNNIGGAKGIYRNIFHDNLGKYTIHLYSGGKNYLKDFTCEDNIIGGDPVHTGGGFGLKDFIYRRNVQWGDYVQHGRYTKSGYWNETATISDNESIDISGWSLNANTDLPWVSLTESGNLFYGDAWPTGAENRAGYSLVAKPATKVWLKAFTKSARWLGYVTIYNRDSAATVSVDFSSLLANGNYLLRNTENPTETWAFTMTGAAANVPCNIWTRADVIGTGAVATQWPIFGSCVIEAV